MKKRLGLVLLSLSILISALSVCIPGRAYASDNLDNMKGIWLSCYDYAKLGMSNASEEKYVKKVDEFLEAAAKYKLNTVFLHVRSFDDAIWLSDTFPACSYLKSSANRSVPASETYAYDPLALFIEEASEYGIEVHAWMNPYRITLNQFLDPGKSANQKRVKKAIKELLNYDIAGIHFDDYFYHSQGGFVKNYKSDKIYARDITPDKKRANVNKLIRSVYKLCSKNNLTFGISPQGNYDNDMNSGADVQTWLSQEGYVDYVAPQIYWTNQYGSDGKTTMFTDRLNQFNSLHTNSARMYVGLALYRCGVDFSYDRGWISSGKNMKKQIKEAKKKGWNGYIMFSASNLFNSESAKERKNLLK